MSASADTRPRGTPSGSSTRPIVDVDGAALRAELIAAGVLVPGSGLALTRMDLGGRPTFRLDAPQ